MIRNFQRTSSDSNVDLSPIYNSLQTINALLYRLDVQTTIPSAIDELSRDINNIDAKLDNITRDDYSLAYYITDPVLSKPLYQYNNYSTLQSTGPIIVFEPYVQSITNYEHLEGRYYFGYNLPNATLNYIVGPDSHHAVEYEALTCKVFNNFGFWGTSCVINTMNVTQLRITNCSIQSLSAKIATINNCDINTLNVENSGNIYNCFLKNNTINGCNIYSCLGYNVNGKRNNFVSCTLANYPTISNTFREMNLNNVNILKNVRAMTCNLDCDNKNANNSFVNCTFDNVSIHHLTHTNFINCNGNIYIPRLINGVNMFDNNNNYIGNYVETMSITSSSTYTDTSSYSFAFDSTVWYESTYTEYEPSYINTSTDTTYSYSDTTTSLTWNDPDSHITSTFTTSIGFTEDTSTDTMLLDTYTSTSLTWNDPDSHITSTFTYSTHYWSTITEPVMSSSSYIREVSTTDTNTLTSNYDTTISLENQLTVKILPEWNTPNIFTNNGIASKYINTYVNINNYTISSPGFTANNVTGNIEMYISSITTNYIIANNDLYKLKLNVKNLNGPFMVTSNTIKDGDILIDSFVNPTIAFSQNTFDKLNLYYNYTHNQSMVLENNDFNVLNVQAGARGNLRLVGCTINNGVLYGWNGLYSCTANYIENYGENSYSKNSINTLRVHNINLMYDNTISKLIIEPNDYDNLSFIGNNIGTIICPSYYPISASAIYNTFGTIIPY